MLGEALRLLRVFHDYKATVVSEKLGISQGYLSELESGKKNPSLELVGRYAEVFKTTPSAIMAMSEGLDKDPKTIREKISKVLVNFLQTVEENGEK